MNKLKIILLLIICQNALGVKKLLWSHNIEQSYGTLVLNTYHDLNHFRKYNVLFRLPEIHPLCGQDFEDVPFGDIETGEYFVYDAKKKEKLGGNSSFSMSPETQFITTAGIVDCVALIMYSPSKKITVFAHLVKLDIQNRGEWGLEKYLIPKFISYLGDANDIQTYLLSPYVTDDYLSVYEFLRQANIQVTAAYVPFASIVSVPDEHLE